MKITDLRCAVIGRHPIVRIVTDEGLHGLREVEFTKTYLKPFVLHFREALIGEDPTDVERVMLKIRQRGSFKPYGAAVSAIEHALWDIAGKAAGVPAYKLLGGKVRDKVRVYNGSIRRKRTGDRPEDYAADVKWMMEQPQNFFMVKQGISFHSNMKDSIEGFHYGVTQKKAGYHGAMDQGAISERGFNHMLDCVIAMKEVLGDKVSLALDCGPGWMLPDAIKFARAVEKYNLMWLEDMLTGDYVPWVNPQAYRELTTSTSTPIHTDDANDGMPPDDGAAQVGDLHGAVLFHRRESCRREQLAADIGNDLPVALRLVAGLVPHRIGDESRPFRLTLGQRFPGEEIGEAIAVFADRRGEKPGLADAMPLPNGQRLVGKALEQSRQPARQAVIDTQFVDHGFVRFFLRLSLGRGRHEWSVVGPVSLRGMRAGVWANSRSGPSYIRSPSARWIAISP